MAITHAAVKASGERGYASEWNAEHVISAESAPKSSVTLIVAASDSLDKTKADYICDGTADEAEINTAITALPATGGKVQLLEGTYYLANTISIIRNAVLISGCGWGTVLYLVAGANKNMITVGNNSATFSGVEIRDLKIDGNGAAQASNGRAILFYKNVTKSRIRNVHVNNCRLGIHIYWSCTYNEISGCRIEATGVAASAYGLALYYLCDSNRIENNEICSCYDGAWIFDSLYNIILGNSCNDNTNIGIYEEGTSDNNVIVANVAVNNGAANITTTGAGTIEHHNKGGTET